MAADPQNHKALRNALFGDDSELEHEATDRAAVEHRGLEHGGHLQRGPRQVLGETVIAVTFEGGPRSRTVAEHPDVEVGR